MQPADQPSELRRRCEDEAQDMVRLSNTLPDGEQRVQNPALAQLISRLAALLLQIRVRDTETLRHFCTHPVAEFITADSLIRGILFSSAVLGRGWGPEFI